MKRHPTMVVPVLVAFGSGMPRSVRKVFLDAHGLTCSLRDDRSCNIPDFVCEVKSRTRVDRCCRHVAQKSGEDSKDEEEMGV